MTISYDPVKPSLVDSGVCMRCRDFFSDDSFGKWKNETVRHDFQKGCGMCHLVQSVSVEKEVGYPTNISPAKKIKLQHPMFRSIPIPTGVSVDGIRSDRIWSHSLPKDNKGIPVIAEVDVTKLQPELLWQSAEELVDFGRLRLLMQQCSEREAVQQQPKGMRLIHVPTRQIIHASPDMKYAALSYVWGSVAGPMQFREELPENVPRTIEDCLFASAQLNIDYLWIDRYCIRQDDAEEKAAQIHKMHEIYQNAYVTMFAVVGDGPDHGIPGISRPRTFLPHAFMDGRLFVAIHNPRRVIRDSTWASRGWTYQEDFLSTRKLFFLGNQVLFRCTRTERTAIEGPLRNPEPPRHTEYEVRPYDWNVAAQRFIATQHMWDHIMEVNRRGFADEADRINAILGIFGHLQVTGLISGHVYGIPVLSEFCENNDLALNIRNWKEGFLNGLLWCTGQEQRGNPRRRRRQFPSWTWAAWQGVLGPRAQCREDNIAVSLETSPDGQLFSSEQWAGAFQETSSLALGVRYIHLEAPAIELRLLELIK
ncbi:hypothetical protein SLS55_010380 [Diplodia seriata]|uniref:Heterokaryon incompatibility domain-containing protein n=1 Tax=Diplodia seriata TaxID=420778 RepID=A0ABR3C0V6_9PEZI